MRLKSGTEVHFCKSFPSKQLRSAFAHQIDSELNVILGPACSNSAADGIVICLPEQPQRVQRSKAFVVEPARICPGERISHFLEPDFWLACKIRIHERRISRPSALRSHRSIDTIRSQNGCRSMHEGVFVRQCEDASAGCARMPVRGAYSARSISAGSIRTAWITAGNEASSAAATMASDKRRTLMPCQVAVT